MIYPTFINLEINSGKILKIIFSQDFVYRLVIDKLPIKGSGMVSVNLAKKQVKDEPSVLSQVARVLSFRKYVHVQDSDFFQLVFTLNMASQ